MLKSTEEVLFASYLIFFKNIYRTKVKTLHYNYLYFKRKYWTKSIY